MQAKIVLPNEELEYGAAEAIKTLRTNIMYSEDVKAIMLTSTMPARESRPFLWSWRGVLRH